MTLNNNNRFRNTSGRLWVNVAASTHALPGFVNIDNSAFLLLSGRLFSLACWLFRGHASVIGRWRDARKVGPYIRRDCRKPLPFRENSVDHILCSHFLEHVYPDEAERIIADFHRILKDGGTLHVIVPDMEKQAREYLAARGAGVTDAADQLVRSTLLSTENRRSLVYRMLETHGGFGLQHRWMYDQDSMARRLRKAGFWLLDRNETPSSEYGPGDVHVVARKGQPRSP